MALGAMRPRRSLLGGGLGRLGAGTAADTTQYSLAAGLFRQARVALNQLQQSYAQTPDAFSSDTLQRINESQQRYTTLLNAYIYAYAAAVGNPPDTTGLLGHGGPGLGQWQTYVVVGVAIGVIVAGLYELNQYLQATQMQAQADLNKSQTAMNAQAQAANLQNQAAAAYASGDTTTGDSLTVLANQASAIATSASAPAQTLSDFVSQNAGWIAAGVAAVVILPRLLK
jgi:hypothetical protein